MSRIHREEDDGSKRCIVSAGPCRVEARVKFHVKISGGSSETQAQKYLKKAEESRHAKNALMLLAEAEASWPRLYLALEEIERFIGKTSSPERKRFTQSANSGAVGGLDSRHASGNIPPPENPMTLDEARGFVVSVVRDALNSRGA